MAVPGDRTAERYRPFAGVQVDHATACGGARAALELDFATLPPDGGFAFVAEAPPGARTLPSGAARRFGRALADTWEARQRDAGSAGRQVYGARTVLHRAEAHGAAEPFDRVLAASAELVVDEVWDALEAGRAPRPVGRRALERPPPLPHALPGVYVDHVVQTACPALFAVVWADVEPLPGGAPEDFAFAADLPATCRTPGRPLPREFAEAFGDGVRAMWERKGRGRPPFAARVVLRDARWSEVDSSERGFHAAGGIAATEVLRCVAEGRGPRPVGRSARRHRAIPPMPRTRPRP